MINIKQLDSSCSPPQFLNRLQELFGNISIVITVISFVFEIVGQTVPLGVLVSCFQLLSTCQLFVSQKGFHFTTILSQFVGHPYPPVCGFFFCHKSYMYIEYTLYCGYPVGLGVSRFQRFNGQIGVSVLQYKYLAL